MTLIQRQEACLARMAEPRTSWRRAAKNCSAALRAFRKDCIAKGYSVAEANQLTQDVRDMHTLLQLAED